VDWGKLLGRVAPPLSALLVGACLALSAVAQPASESQDKEYDAAFQEMLRQPGNLDVLFRFATVATQTGDLEGAVSALERMLLIDPNLPRVRLELGVLYYRLGSYEIARTYLQSALASRNVPPEVRAKAEQFMAELDKRLTRSRFSGEIFLGTRYQSNANLGPGGSQVRLFGQVANLNQAALGTPDWGAVSTGQFRHTYDLETQDKAAIESQFTYYVTRQFQLQAANVSLIDFTTGPRFQAFRETFEDVIVKPFVSAGYIWVNDTPYYGSYGGGVETGVLLSDNLRNVSIFSWRQQNYPNTWYLPNNSQFTGAQYSATSTFQYQLNPLVSLFAVANAQRYQTQLTPQQNYMLLGTGAGFAFRFPDPLFRSDQPWTISLSANLQWWKYDQPDPIVDPDVIRYQQDTIINLLLAVPFDERTTFSLSLARFNRAASLPNYEFTNNSAMFGVSWRF
jgi:tetratricopeptide (TPR) repeat protein